MKDDFEFMERITRDLAARKADCKVLEVSEDAGKKELMRLSTEHRTTVEPLDSL